MLFWVGINRIRGEQYFEGSEYQEVEDMATETHDSGSDRTHKHQSECKASKEVGQYIEVRSDSVLAIMS